MNHLCDICTNDLGYNITTTSATGREITSVIPNNPDGLEAISDIFDIVEKYGGEVTVGQNGDFVVSFDSSQIQEFLSSTSTVANMENVPNWNGTATALAATTVNAVNAVSTGTDWCSTYKEASTDSSTGNITMPSSSNVADMISSGNLPSAANTLSLFSNKFTNMAVRPGVISNQSMLQSINSPATAVSVANSYRSSVVKPDTANSSTEQVTATYNNFITSTPSSQFDMPDMVIDNTVTALVEINGISGIGITDILNQIENADKTVLHVGSSAVTGYGYSQSNDFKNAGSDNNTSGYGSDSISGSTSSSYTSDSNTFSGRSEYVTYSSIDAERMTYQEAFNAGLRGEDHYSTSTDYWNGSSQDQMSIQTGGFDSGLFDAQSYVSSNINEYIKEMDALVGKDWVKSSNYFTTGSGKASEQYQYESGKAVYDTLGNIVKLKEISTYSDDSTFTSDNVASNPNYSKSVTIEDNSWFNDVTNADTNPNYGRVVSSQNINYFGDSEVGTYIAKMSSSIYEVTPDMAEYFRNFALTNYGTIGNLDDSTLSTIGSSLFMEEYDRLTDNANGILGKYNPTDIKISPFGTSTFSIQDYTTLVMSAKGESNTLYDTFGGNSLRAGELAWARSEVENPTTYEAYSTAIDLLDKAVDVDGLISANKEVKSIVNIIKSYEDYVDNTNTDDESDGILNSTNVQKIMSITNVNLNKGVWDTYRGNIGNDGTDANTIGIAGMLYKNDKIDVNNLASIDTVLSKDTIFGRLTGDTDAYRKAAEKLFQESANTNGILSDIAKQEGYADARDGFFAQLFGNNNVNYLYSTTNTGYAADDALAGNTTLIGLKEGTASYKAAMDAKVLLAATSAQAKNGDIDRSSRRQSFNYTTASNGDIIVSDTTYDNKNILLDALKVLVTTTGLGALGTVAGGFLANIAQGNNIANGLGAFTGNVNLTRLQLSGGITTDEKGIVTADTIKSSTAEGTTTALNGMTGLVAKTYSEITGNNVYGEKTLLSMGVENIGVGLYGVQVGIKMIDNIKDAKGNISDAKNSLANSKPTSEQLNNSLYTIDANDKYATAKQTYNAGVMEDYKSYVSYIDSTINALGGIEKKLNQVCKLVIGVTGLGAVDVSSNIYSVVTPYIRDIPSVSFNGGDFSISSIQPSYPTTVMSDSPIQTFLDNSTASSYGITSIVNSTFTNDSYRFTSTINTIHSASSSIDNTFGAFSDTTEYSNQTFSDPMVTRQLTESEIRAKEVARLEAAERAKTRAIEAAKAAEEKRIADEKAAEAKRIADEKAAEAKRIADEKAAEEKRIAEAKAAEERAKAEAYAAEQKRIADEKAAKDAEMKKLYGTDLLSGADGMGDINGYTQVTLYDDTSPFTNLANSTYEPVTASCLYSGVPLLNSIYGTYSSSVTRNFDNIHATMAVALAGVTKESSGLFALTAGSVDFASKIGYKYF